MASRRERREWRAEFKSFGVGLTCDWVRISIWREEKLQEARRWLYWQEHRHHYIGVIVGVIIAVIGIIAAYFR
jgi:hypothetical protein